MAHFTGLEADNKQLQKHSKESVFEKYLKKTNTDQPQNGELKSDQAVLMAGFDIKHLLYMHEDKYSIIEDKHLHGLDINKPSYEPFRWSTDNGIMETRVILNVSSRFGPKCFIKLEVDPIEDNLFDFHIRKVYILEENHEGCLVPVKQDLEAEGKTIRLGLGDIFTYTQLESIANVFDCEWTWEDTPQLKSYPLIQYWAFHHKEAVDWLEREEMYNA